MKENFYVFLDIDGVLVDETCKEENKNFPGIKKFKTKSVEALQFLFSEFGKKYDVILVAMSDWKMNIAKTYLILEEAELLNVRKVEMSKIKQFETKGLEIEDYLNGKENSNNFVVLDDEPNYLIPNIKEDNIVETSFQESLYKEQLQPIFKKFGVAFDKEDKKEGSAIKRLNRKESEELEA